MLTLLYTKSIYVLYSQGVGFKTQMVPGKEDFGAKTGNGISNDQKLCYGYSRCTILELLNAQSTILLTCTKIDND